MPRFRTIIKRTDFLKAAKAHKWVAPTLVVQACKRTDHDGCRVGITVSSQVGGAVERNRIKRRLREAIAKELSPLGQDNVDYVFIARPTATQKASLEDICKDIRWSLKKLNERIGSSQ